jgi:hypothetical protein
MFGTREEVLSAIASGRAKPPQPPTVPLEPARANGAHKINGNGSANGASPQQKEIPATANGADELAGDSMPGLSDDEMIPVPTKVAMVPSTRRAPLQPDQAPATVDVDDGIPPTIPEQDAGGGDRAVSR